MMDWAFSNTAWQFYRVALYGVALLAFLSVFVFTAIFNPTALRGVE